MTASIFSLALFDLSPGADPTHPVAFVARLHIFSFFQRASVRELTLYSSKFVVAHTPCDGRVHCVSIDNGLCCYVLKPQDGTAAFALTGTCASAIPIVALRRLATLHRSTAGCLTEAGLVLLLEKYATDTTDANKEALVSAHHEEAATCIPVEQLVGSKGLDDFLRAMPVQPSWKVHKPPTWPCVIA